MRVKSGKAVMDRGQCESEEWEGSHGQRSEWEGSHGQRAV